MSTQLHFDSLEILDWYDGPVVAVGTSGDLHFLVFLIACEITFDATNRIYAVLPIDRLDAEKLVSPDVTDPTSSRDQYVVFQDLFDSFLARYEGEAYLTKEVAEKGKSIDVYATMGFKPMDFVPYDTSAVFDNSRYETWAYRLDKSMH